MPSHNLLLCLQFHFGNWTWSCRLMLPDAVRMGEVDRVGESIARRIIQGIDNTDAGFYSHSSRLCKENRYKIKYVPTLQHAAISFSLTL